MSDKRLFVAIDFPPEIKTQIETVCDGLRDVRWVERDQMHLTLRFIGEIEMDRFKEVKDSLQSVRFEPFTLTLKGVGHFPQQGLPRVLWVGVEASGALKRLARDVERAIVSLGFEPDRHPFSAHVTLARLKYPPPAGELKRFYERNKRFASDPMTVEAFSLFSSVLSRDGAVYQVEATYPMRRTPPVQPSDSPPQE